MYNFKLSNKNLDIKKSSYKKDKKENLNKKRGSELVESMLLIGITVALVVVIFYPQISKLIEAALSAIEVWFNGAIGSICNLGG